MTPPLAGPAIHKAEVIVSMWNGVGTPPPTSCKHCGEEVKRVPGGDGPVWVHVETGAVVGDGAPKTFAHNPLASPLDQARERAREARQDRLTAATLPEQESATEYVHRSDYLESMEDMHDAALTTLVRRLHAVADWIEDRRGIPLDGSSLLRGDAHSRNATRIISEVRGTLGNLNLDDVMRTALDADHAARSARAADPSARIKVAMGELTDTDRDADMRVSRAMIALGDGGPALLDAIDTNGEDPDA